MLNIRILATLILVLPLLTPNKSNYLVQLMWLKIFVVACLFTAPLIVKCSFIWKIIMFLSMYLLTR